MSTIEKGFAQIRAKSADLRPVNEDQSLASRRHIDDRGPLILDNLTTVRLNPKTLADNRVVTDEASGASSAYKMLRTRVLQRMVRNGWKTVAVTGTCPNEGKSLTAINLSISLARNTSTSVVLTDLDLRKPSLHRHLGLSRNYGISDYLRGVAPLEKVAIRPGYDRLAVIPNDRPFLESSEMLTAPPMLKLVETVKQGEGRIAVFDLPPVLASDDLLAFAPMVDAVLLVVSPGTTKRQDMLAAYELLQDVNILGVVLNGSSEDVAPYYYYGQR